MSYDKIGTDQPNASPQPVGATDAPTANSAALKGLEIDPKGAFFLVLTASLVDGGEGGTGENGFSGGAHGGVDFGTAGGDFKFVIPTGQFVTVVSASLMPRDEEGAGEAGFSGGAHGGVDFGKAGGELKVVIPVTPH